VCAIVISVVAIATHYCWQNGSLQDMITSSHGNQQQPVEEKYIIQLFVRVGKALQVMHTMSPSIAHRDITVSWALYGNGEYCIDDLLMW